MKHDTEAQVAWHIFNILWDITDHLWNQYELQFLDIRREEEKPVGQTDNALVDDPF